MWRPDRTRHQHDHPPLQPNTGLISGKLSEVGGPFLKAIQNECQAQNLLFGDAAQSIELRTGSTTPALENLAPASAGGDHLKS
jgi:hypothetical protein